jgi:hypothetical protein
MNKANKIDLFLRELKTIPVNTQLELTTDQQEQEVITVLKTTPKKYNYSLMIDGTVEENSSADNVPINQVQYFLEHTSLTKYKFLERNGELVCNLNRRTG